MTKNLVVANAVKKAFNPKNCSSEKTTIVTNLNLYGDLGKTTETLAVINLMHAIGIDPVLISADPTSEVFTTIYGSKNKFGQPLAANQQVLGQGVFCIDLEDKDGSLVDALLHESIEGRDVVVDNKGGVFASFKKLYDGLEPFYSAFEYTNHRFININCITDMKKGMAFLEEEFISNDEVTCSTERHLVRIVSLGMIEHQKNYEAILEAIAEFDRTHIYSNPNVHVHTLAFKTSWKKEEVRTYFSTKNIRADYFQSSGQLRAIVPQFLNERDKEWSKILFDEATIDEIAEFPNPLFKQMPNAPKWGKVLKGPTWESKK